MTRIWFLLFYIFLSSCALQMPPEGGAKDVLPPKIISTQPENKSLNFSGKSIRIDFDELVSVSELSSQLVISPLLKNIPEIKARKNSLFILINDTLRENTTYTMNFGTGIADNNEGNKLEDYQFVFSTGSILDTLSINGKVTKAFDMTTEKGVLVSLYQSESDSTPYLERPVYFTRTNESGSFKITNISPGIYRIFAIADKDANYLYSSEEMIAFNNSTVQSNDTGIQLRLFSEVPSLRFLKSYSEFPGKAAFVFSAPADSVKLNWLTDTAKLDIYAQTFSEQRDTITIWYKNITADSLVIAFNGIPSYDTVVVRLFRKAEAKSGRRAEKVFNIGPALNQSSIQHLHLPYFMQATRPIDAAIFSNIVLLEDSQIISPGFKFIDSLKRNIQVSHPWKSKSNYILFIPPGTFTDIYGVTNDTTNLLFTAHNESDYGSVTVKLKKWEAEPYILQLVNEDGSRIFRQTIINADTTIEMFNLDPGQYRLKFIRDLNANGKWDSGNYLKKIQPESIEFYNEPILVRGNWDIEFQMTLPLPAKQP